MVVSGPILITGAAGRVGGVGRALVEGLRRRGVAVRALVRVDDARAAALRAMGAEVVVGDLTNTVDVARALSGCRRAYLGLSVSPDYLEATAVFAAVARETANLDMLVNMSQMTVSQMNLQATTDSHQQRLHWLAEQVLNWSGLPVVHVRPTVFLEHPFFLNWAADSIARDGTLRLPFGAARTSPISVRDVVEAIETILVGDAASRVGKVFELIGPCSLDMNEIASEYAVVLGRPVKYVDEPFEQWQAREVYGDASKMTEQSDHLKNHMITMAKLHAAGRYDRLSRDFEVVTGKMPRTVRQFVEENKARFGAA